jgi:hypothetical protein
MKDRTPSYTIVCPDDEEKEHKTDEPLKKQKKEKKKKEKKFISSGNRNNRVLLDSSRQREWLSDAIVANIMSELLKRCLYPTKDSLLFCHYPRSLSQVHEWLGSDSKTFEEASRIGGLILIPININDNHWVLMVMDLRQDEQVVLYFDPLGYDIPRKILPSLSLNYPDLVIHTYRQKVQYDGCQCGVWICWFLSLVLERVNKNETCTNFVLTDYSVFVNINIRNHDFEKKLKRNEQHILTLRETFADWILYAHKRGTLEFT